MSAEIPPSLDLPVLWYLNNKANNYSIPLHAVNAHHSQRHKVWTESNTTIYDPLLDSLFAAHNLNSSIKLVAVSVVAVQLMTKMLLLPAAAVCLLVMFAFIAIVQSTYLLTNGRCQLNFAIQETMQDTTSALVFGSYLHVMEPIHHNQQYQHVNNLYTCGYQAPNQGRLARNEPPKLVCVEVYPVQESLRGYQGTSVRV